jgi:hypothetical protein
MIDRYAVISFVYVLNPWRSLLGRHGAAGLSCGAREIAAGMRSVAEALSLSHGTVFSTGTSWGIFGQLNDIHMVIDIN